MTIKEYVRQVDVYQFFEYPKDIKRIVEICEKHDIQITPDEAEELWNWYSDDYCAQWLCLPSDDEDLFEIIIKYAKKIWGDEEHER